jgi:hypothetical protein
LNGSLSSGDNRLSVAAGLSTAAALLETLSAWATM